MLNWYTPSVKGLDLHAKSKKQNSAAKSLQKVQAITQYCGTLHNPNFSHLAPPPLQICYWKVLILMAMATLLECFLIPVPLKPSTAERAGFYSIIH